MNNRVRRPSAFGPLHELLLRCCRPGEKGEKSIPILAKQLSMTNAAVYKWVHSQYLPSWRAEELALMSEGEVELTEFYPYIFKKH